MVGTTELDEQLRCDVRTTGVSAVLQDVDKIR